jgi:hypothetical protein
MGRIITPVIISNVLDPSKHIHCEAPVDTGTSHLVLPTAWHDQLGELRMIGEQEFEMATQTTVKGEICGPVEIQVEGFRPVIFEVVFVEMTPRDGIYEPLLGYLVLEACPAAVDMLGHRLVAVKHLDLK